MKPKGLQVAVLGDVHGHLTLAYAILKRWETETLRTLDVILQVGDMGVFPPPYRMDKATRRFAERDPDELGFTDYYEGGDDASSIFGPEATPSRALTADTVFIKGNHEDFIFLDEMSHGAREPVPVDCYERVKFLPSGQVFSFERRGITLRVGGLGGVSIHGSMGCDPVSENYTGDELRALRTYTQPIDVLLTHEPPWAYGSAISSRYAETGSRDTAALLTELNPTYHFCGHFHEHGQRLACPGPTESHILNAVNFHKPTRLNPGCIGILTWTSAHEHRYEVLDAPWIKQYTRYNYRARYA